MSGYIQVIYGSVLPLTACTGDIERRAWECLDDGTLVRPYSGNGEAAYYAGVVVTTLRQYAWPADGYEVHDFTPTDKQRADAQRAVEAVPEDLYRHMTRIGLYVLPCP